MKTVPNYLAWLAGSAFILGGWLMQQPHDFQWVQIFAPYNVGSLLVALLGGYITGKGVTQKGQ